MKKWWKCINLESTGIQPMMQQKKVQVLVLFDMIIESSRTTIFAFMSSNLQVETNFISLGKFFPFYIFLSLVFKFYFSLSMSFCLVGFLFFLRLFIFKFCLFASSWTIDAPLSSLMDSTTSPKVKTMEGKGVEVCSLARSISRVKGRARASGWGLGILTRNSIIHTDLHKPNNKLVSV